MSVRIKIIIFLILSCLYSACWYKGIEVKIKNRGETIEKR